MSQLITLDQKYLLNIQTLEIKPWVVQNFTLDQKRGLIVQK